MKEVWNKKWKKILIWASAYLSFIAFAFVGGYVLVKSEDDELKKTTKNALIVTLICTAVSAILSVFYNIASLSSGYYSSWAYDFYRITSNLVNIAKIAVYAGIIIKILLNKEKTNEVKKEIQNEEIV